jgi:hypothetical protein
MKAVVRTQAIPERTYMLLNLLMNFGALLLGGLISWYFSRLYYKKSGDELRDEAARLRHLSTLMLNAMEDAKLVKLNRDQSGEPLGRIVELSAKFEGSTTMGGDLQVKPAVID